MRLIGTGESTWPGPTWKVLVGLQLSSLRARLDGPDLEGDNETQSGGRIY